jgi:hypothetical protein
LTNNVYSVNYIIDQLDKTKNQLLDLNFEAFLRIALKFYPIISSFQSFTQNNNNDQSKLRSFRSLHFCAESIHEYYSWPYGKRKAMEWMRALHIKRKCEEIIKSVQNISDAKFIEIWSTKSILLWLRSHGYTPLEYQHMTLPCDNDLDKTAESVLTTNYVNSLTPFNRILNNQIYIKIFDKLDETSEDADNDDLIIDVENTHDTTRYKNSKIENRKVESSFNEKANNYIEMCEGSKYVCEQLELVSDFKILDFLIELILKQIIFLNF